MDSLYFATVKSTKCLTVSESENEVLSVQNADDDKNKRQNNSSAVQN